MKPIAGVFGSPDGIPMEVVLKEMIDASCGEGNADLVVPASPGFMLLTFDQRKKPLLEALQAIAYMIGWEVEFAVSPAPDFRPTFTLKAPLRVT